MDDGDTSSETLAEMLYPAASRRLRALPSLTGRSIALVWAAARRELVLTAGLQAVSSIALGGQLIVGRELLKHLLTLSGRGSIAGAMPYVIALSAAVGIVSLANVIRFEYQQLLGELVSRHSLQQVLRVAARVDLLSFESPDFHNRLQRALFNASIRPLQMATGVLSMIGSLFGVIALGAALVTIAPVLALLSIGAVAPVAFMTVRAGQALYEFGFTQTERDRRRTYLQLLLTQKDAAKEVRGYGLGSHLQSIYRDLYARRIAALRTVIAKRARQGLLGSLAASVLSGATLALLVWLVSTGRLSLASAGAAAGGLLLLGGQLQGLVAGAGSLYESALFVQDFTSFLDGPGARAEEPPASDPGTAAVPEEFELLEVDRVCFTYPSRSEAAISEISIKLRRGQVVALVGENGSGKSTLAKVLAGLYPPSTGSVRWDGVDIATIGEAAVRDRTAILFQDFVHYQMTAAENVTMGRWERRDDHAALHEASQRAEADDFLQRLPQGYATQLGPEFAGGVDLSGGQWQRMALARAFFRDAALVILDEPTASLDPRSEAQLFGAVRGLYAGRTVLLISHRMASVRLADYIYVLAAGRIVEHGTHADLMEHAGLYAELFALQATAYQG